MGNLFPVIYAKIFAANATPGTSLQMSAMSLFSNLEVFFWKERYINFFKQ